MTRPLPLAGRTVVEHVRPGSSEVTVRAVALAGRIAADLGARVLRWSEDGDPLAASPADSTFLNAGKIAAGPASDGVHGADAVIHDAGAALPESLAQIAVRVEIRTGVPAGLRIPDALVTDTTVLALSGLLDIIGHPDAAPVPLGGHQAAGLAGLAAFSGLAAALAARGPDTVRVSALEACLWSNWKSYAERLYMGRTPTRQGRLSEWQALPCTDGFAALIFLDKDWPAVCRMIGDPRLSQPPLDTQAGRRADMSKVYEIVRPWFATRSRDDIYKAARKEGLPLAPVLSLAEVLADAQFAACRFFAPTVDADGAQATWRVPTLPTAWDGARFPPRPPTARPMATAAAPGEPQSRPLAGCRVLDLGIITAGASTAALLADLGADVIKIEASAYIDPFRTWDRGLGAPDWWNRSRFFEFTNRNKRGLALDLKSERGKALFLDLVAEADVLVENFRRGVLERLGIGWEVLAARNPRLVLAQITSQGEAGPDAGAATYGSSLEANSGLSDLTRDARGAPLISGILLNYPDQIVSIYAAGIVTLAVMEQRRTGKGARLDISQRELATFLLGEHILAASSAGALPAPGEMAPRPVIERDAAAGWVVRHADGSRAPVRNGDAILQAVAAGEITMAFAKAPDGSEAKGVPFALDRAPLVVTRRAPGLGQHNAEVLREVLNLDDAAIAALEAQGIVGTVPR